jgi:hypothetical protein
VRHAIAVFVLIVAPQLHADVLTDVRNALSQLGATTPVHGSFDVTTSTKSEDDSDAGRSTVSFDIVDGALRVIYPKAMLAQSVVEAKAEAANPDAPTPVRTGARSVRALHLADLVDAGSYLTIALQKATLTAAKPATWNGRTVRQLTVKLEPGLSASSKKRVKKFESVMTMYVGDDNIPLAADRTTTLKASMLLMSIEQESRVKWTFTRTGDRIVTTKYEESQKVDGMGQHTLTTTTEVVKLEP